MFNPNALKFKGFYYNIDAFVMDIANEFYKECAYYINSLDSTATATQIDLVEADSLPYTIYNSDSTVSNMSIDTSIVGFDLLGNLLSNTDNLNTSVFSMGWFHSIDKESILHTFSDYKKSVGKSANELGSKLPLWITIANARILFKDTDYTRRAFIDCVVYVLRNMLYTCKSADPDIKNISVDKLMSYTSIPIDDIARLFDEYIHDMGLNNESTIKYVNLPFVCYNLTRWVFLMTKETGNDQLATLIGFTRNASSSISKRLAAEFKQKNEVSENCVLTAQFLISELISRGIQPVKAIFDNVLKVCAASTTNDEALLLFANTYLEEQIGPNPATPYNTMRLARSDIGKNASDKLMEEQSRKRAEQDSLDSQQRRKYDCYEAVQEAVAEARAKDAATATASATARANTVNVQRDAAATPGVTATLPPSNTTPLPPAPPASSAPPAPNSTTAGTTTSTSTPDNAAAPTPTSTLTPGDVAADRPSGFTPRTRRATHRSKHADWDGLDPTQLAAYNGQIHAEHMSRGKSDLDKYARAQQTAASVSSSTSALFMTPAYSMLSRPPATKSKSASQYKSSFGDKEFTTMIYQ